MPSPDFGRRMQWAATKRRQRAGVTAQVPAGKARAHLLALRVAGVGTRQMETLTGLSRPALRAILSGERQAIRRTTERAVLAIPPVVAPGALTTGWWAKRHVENLLAEGFTRRQILGLLGRSRVRFRRRMRVGTAQQIAALHERLMA